MNMKYKVGGVVASAVLMLTLLAPKALADTSLEISGNGEGSTNTIVATHVESCEVTQKANTEVVALVNTSASTGGNEASGNTGGNVTVDTGNATATSTVDVTGGSNIAVNPCCCQGPCPDGQTDTSSSALISGNGANTTNTVVATKSKSSKVKQKANTGVLAGVTTKAKTGKNKANSNTGPGTVKIDTGTAASTTDALVTGGPNDFLTP